MTKNPSILPRFDREARERIAALFRRSPPLQIIASLDSYSEPETDERGAYEKYYGWALYEAGDYCGSRAHLVRALRYSRTTLSDRALVRGLLAESYLRTGQLDRAERCAHRALAQIPEHDPGNYLRVGHLCLLGRVYRRQGHLTHAIETYRRGRALADDKSPHATTLTANLALALLYRGAVDEADAFVRRHRQAAEPAPASQDWCIAQVESEIALELGDLARAERVLDEALESYAERFGERVGLVLHEHRAAAFRARGDWRRSEETLRSVLDHCVPGGRNGDMVACTARGLAESLAGQSRHEEALDPARLAERTGRFEDRAEWAAALRVLGECLAALGRRDEARRAFQEARSLHERTEFALERQRLEATLARLGFEGLTILSRLGTQLAPSGFQSHEESLRSGRIAGERAALARALAESHGVVSHAARSLGLSRQAFYKALRRTGLVTDPPSSGRARQETGEYSET